MRIDEIASMYPGDYEGGKDDMPTYNEDLFKQALRKSFPLPGSTLRYTSTGLDGERAIIRLIDPNIKSDNEWGSREIVGQLKINRARWPTKAWQVNTVTVNEDYRNMGMATALYGIVLSIMKATLLSGDMQTPGGKQMWTSLTKMSGIEVSGYGTLEDSVFDDLEPNAMETLIDAIMELGADFIGKYTAWGEKYHVFKFPVNVNPNKVLQNAINDTKISLYGNRMHPFAFGDTGLMAKWTGQ